MNETEISETRIRELVEVHEGAAANLRDLLSGGAVAGDDYEYDATLAEETAAAIRQLISERDALKADAARLDWLSENGAGVAFYVAEYGVFNSEQWEFVEPSLREAIDAAMSS